MPEKWASGGYWYGCVVFVHVLLMITVYSAGPVGRAGFAAVAAADEPGGAPGGAVFELLPQATSGSRAIASTDGRRARMTVPSAGDAARLVQKAGGRHSSQGLAREHSARSCRVRALKRRLGEDTSPEGLKGRISRPDQTRAGAMNRNTGPPYSATRP